MGRATRTTLQKKIDISIVAKQRLRGKTFLQIAQFINEHWPRERLYTEAMAKADWKEAVEAIEEEQDVETKQAKAIEVAWHDNMEAELWERFDASKGVQEKRHLEIVGPLDAGGENGEAVPDGKSRKRSTLSTVQLIGDPRWTQLLIMNRERRAKLTGLDEPDKIDIHLEQEAVVQHRDWNSDKLEEARRMFIALESQRQGGTTTSAGTPADQPNVQW